MKIMEVVRLIDGQVLTTHLDPDLEIEGACGADLMSDVLAAVQPNAILITGLVNLQAIRTAHLADIAAIIFVRGKIPFENVVEFANEERIPLVSTCYGMFETCGRLYQAGIHGSFKQLNNT
jgi:predicted transcriptional regulator